MSYYTEVSLYQLYIIYLYIYRRIPFCCTVGYKWVSVMDCVEFKCIYIYIGNIIVFEKPILSGYGLSISLHYVTIFKSHQNN